MDFNLTPEEEAFRREVRDFLAAELPPPKQRPLKRPRVTTPHRHPLSQR